MVNIALSKLLIFLCFISALLFYSWGLYKIFSSWNELKKKSHQYLFTVVLLTMLFIALKTLNGFYEML